ncbi:multidrug effflux MFS transporter [Edwardsiella ictaluri]|uniref:multidrug effflux MFS transporter n=1 Tax=Edwardsiella ictaluri TaxID=67780 RepID=UPI001E62A54C|nr:multidrug effflux MFS transporter [Edwardsiella ictaluri]
MLTTKNMPANAGLAAFSAQQRIAFILIVSISFLMGISIDLYVPSLPAISHYYHSTIASVELSISLYLLGYGLGQTVLGILSDSYGRKKIFIYSSLCFLLSSIFCVLSDSSTMMNGWRFVQGVAVAGLASGMRAIIVDLFSGLTLKKMANYFALSWALGPIIAPWIGSNLSHYCGWQANFYLFAVYGGVIFLICLFLFRESNHNPSRFELSSIKNNFVEIISNKKFTLLSIIYGLSYSSVLVFNTAGPYLIEVVMHHSELFYGYLAMFLGLAYFVGTIINRYLITKFDNEAILKVGGTMALIVAILLWLLLSYVLNIFTLIIPIFLMFVCIGLIVPNAIAITMVIFPEKAGFATSLCGTIVGLVVFLVTYLIGHVKISALELSLCYFALFLLLNVIKLAVYHQKNRPSPPEHLPPC